MTTKTIKQADTLRDLITAYLATVEEATAKTVAESIGKAEYVSSVINTLNAMRTEALVEAEKKKGRGNEYYYWLTSRPAAGGDPAMLTAIADIRAAIGDGGRLMLTELAGKVREIFVRAQKAEAYEREADCAKEAHAAIAAERVELQRGFAEGQSELGVRARRIAELEAAVELHKECAAASAARIADLEAQLATQRQANAALQEQLANLPDILSVTKEFLVRAPKRRLRIVTKPATAVGLAKAAAKNGSGRGDVYALVHVGTAKRDAVYREAP